jgi:hypothetical protein
MKIQRIACIFWRQFADDRRHVPGFDLREHGVPALAVKGRAGDSVVGEMRQVLEAALCGVVLEDFLLVGYAVGFALKLIVSAETFV